MQTRQGAEKLAKTSVPRKHLEGKDAKEIFTLDLWGWYKWNTYGRAPR